MIDQRVVERLHEMKDSHRDDKDGGDRLIRSIERYAGRLNDEEYPIWWDTLVTLVAEEHPELWSLCLAVLVDTKQYNPDHALFEMTSRTDRSKEWYEELVFALLRRGYAPAKAYCLKYVRAAQRENERDALPLIVDLVRVDRESSLAMLSEYYANELEVNSSSEIARNLIQGIALMYLSIDANMLIQLVERVRSIHTASSKQLAQMMIDELTGVESRKTHNAEAVASLLQALASRA